MQAYKHDFAKEEIMSRPLKNATFLYEKALGSFRENLPFVLYCKPGSEKIIGIFQNDDNLYQIKDFSEKGYAFVSFDGEQSVLIPEDDSEVYIAERPENSDAWEFKDFSENRAAKQEHEKLVQKGIDAIHERQFSKVVLSRKEEVELLNFDPVETFKRVLHFYPDAFSYCWFHPKKGLWLGAFSEQLAKIDGNEIATMALAGTQKWHDGEIVWEEKEKQEQRIVTDFIIDELKAFTDTITVSKSYTLKAGNLAHIKTDIIADTENARIDKILAALHPTPAVCGFPKRAAQDFILKEEGYDREFYSGFHGELNKDFVHNKPQSDLYVNLRCMQIKNQKAILYVGGGITQDSNPEKEWQETVNKVQTMKKIL